MLYLRSHYGGIAQGLLKDFRRQAWRRGATKQIRVPPTRSCLPSCSHGGASCLILTVEYSMSRCMVACSFLRTLVGQVQSVAKDVVNFISAFFFIIFERIGG